MRRPAGIPALALTGAAVATFCDWVHVITGTLIYPDPTWAGQPWWVGPGFFVAFTIMALGYGWLGRILPAGVARSRSLAPGDTTAFVEALASFAFVYMLSGFASDFPGLYGAIAYATFGVRLAVTYERGFAAVIAVAIAVGGTLAEAALNPLGMAHYAYGELLRTPWWLPALYLHGAFALREGWRRFVAL